MTSQVFLNYYYNIVSHNKVDLKLLTEVFILKEDKYQEMKKRIPNIKNIMRIRQSRKKGDMGYLDFFMLGFGSMVGVGWAVSSNHWIAQAGGPIPAFLGFIIATLLLIPIGLCHGELLATLPQGGGVLVYTNKAFGRNLSFISSWFLALSYLTILPWEAIYINTILENLLPWLSSSRVLYYVLGAPIKASSILLGVILALLLFFINFKGSDFASKLQSILSILIIVIGIIVIIFSFKAGSVNNLYPLYQNVGEGSHSSLFGGIIAIVVIVPFFMSGFDTIAQSVEETSPDKKFKNVAIAMVLSIVAAGIFYSLVILSTASVSNWQEYSLASPPAMGYLLQEAYGGKLGYILSKLIIIGTLAGLFSTWNGMFMASARLIQSMAKNNLIPKIFAKEHAEYGTPVTALVFCFIFAAIGPFVGMNLIDPLTSLGSVSFVIGWFLTCLSLVVLINKDKEYYTSFKAPGGKLTIYPAIIISAVIVISTFVPKTPAFMGYTALIIFFFWLFLGLAFLKFYSKKASQ